MHRFFGQKKPAGPPPPSLQDAAGSINDRVKGLDVKIGELDKELIKYKDQLKKVKGPAAEGVKRRAMDCLKRKKMYQGQRDQLGAQAFNIESTCFALDSIKDTQQTVAAMTAGAKQLKAENQKLDIGQIEDMQDDLTDLFEDMEEIQEVMSRAYNCPEGLDDADLDAELAMLGDDLECADFDSEPGYMNSALPSNPQGSILPSNVPVGEVAAAPVSNANVDEYGLPVS
jgi:charged multivesicular body protein 5